MCFIYYYFSSADFFRNQLLKSRIPEKVPNSLDLDLSTNCLQGYQQRIANHIIQYDYLAVTVNVQSRLTVLIM